MQKIYDVEIDLELLEEAQGGRTGFGAVKARRQPLPMCRAEVSQLLREPRATTSGASTPSSSSSRRGSPSFRVIARIEDR